MAKNRIDAKILIEDFRRQLNEVRPRSSLGKLTPVGVQVTTVNNQFRKNNFLSLKWSAESWQVRHASEISVNRGKLVVETLGSAYPPERSAPLPR